MQVGQRLRGMIDVALHVDDRHVGRLGHLAHVPVALAEDQIVADADAVTHRRQDLAGVGGCLAVADLRDVGVQEVGVPAELGHPASKALRVRVDLSKNSRYAV